MYGTSAMPFNYDNECRWTLLKPLLCNIMWVQVQVLLLLVGLKGGGGGE